LKETANSFRHPAIQPELPKGKDLGIGGKEICRVSNFYAKRSHWFRQFTTLANKGYGAKAAYVRKQQVTTFTNLSWRTSY